jgi:hypothetical protein
LSARTFFDSSSVADAVLRTELAMSADAPMLTCAAAAGTRVVRVDIGPEAVHSGSRIGADGSAPPPLMRQWLLRVHLLPGETVACAAIDGVAAHVSAMVWPQVAVVPSPFGGQSAAVAAGGGVAEFVVSSAPADRLRTIQVSIQSSDL